MHRYNVVTVTPMKVNRTKDGGMTAESGGVVTYQTVEAHTRTGAQMGRGRVVSEKRERLPR